MSRDQEQNLGGFFSNGDVDEKDNGGYRVTVRFDQEGVKEFLENIDECLKDSASVRLDFHLKPKGRGSNSYFVGGYYVKSYEAKPREDHDGGGDGQVHSSRSKERGRTQNARSRGNGRRSSPRSR